MVQASTPSGDTGKTTLPSGGRISKSSALVSAIGTIEELDAHLGACRAEVEEEYIDGDFPLLLGILQGQLSRVAAVVYDPREELPSTQWMLREIKRLAEELGPRPGRITPGGSRLACQLLIARAVAHRAERSLVPLVQGPFYTPAEVLAWINLCADMLGILSRYANAIADYPEEVCPI